MRKAPEGRNRHQGALTLIFVMASSGVVKVILSFYRDHEGSAFERHRDRVPFDIEKHNSMEIACKNLKKKKFCNCDEGPAEHGATLSNGKYHK